MTIASIVSLACLLAGAFFFFAGTVGLLRFPDVFTRLHALTKADNLGLGFVCVGLAVTDPAPARIVKLGLVWSLVLASSAISSQLVARYAVDRGMTPWSKP